MLLFFPLHCLGCDLELSRCVRVWLWTAPHPEFPHSLVLPLAQGVPTAVCRLIYVRDIVACLDKAPPGSSPSPQSAWDPCICFMTEYRPLSVKLGLSTWHPLCKGECWMWAPVLLGVIPHFPEFIAKVLAEVHLPIFFSLNLGFAKYYF